MSDSAFPMHPLLKPAPGMRRWWHGLRLPFVHRIVDSVVPFCVGPTTTWRTALEWDVTPPQGLSLRSGFFCPDSSTLVSPIRPTRGHIATSPTMRLIRDAFAVRERLGDPRVVPSFRRSLLPSMPPSMSPGRSESSLSRNIDSDLGLRQDLNGSALPTILPSVSSRARISGLIGSPLLRPVRLLAPLDGSDRVSPQPRGLLHPGFQRVSHLSHCWISLRQSLDSSVGGTLTHWNGN